MPRPRKREPYNKRVGESATLLLLYHTRELGAKDFNLGAFAESFRHHMLDVRDRLVPAWSKAGVWLISFRWLFIPVVAAAAAGSYRKYTELVGDVGWVLSCCCALVLFIVPVLDDRCDLYELLLSFNARHRHC